MSQLSPPGPDRFRRAAPPLVLSLALALSLAPRLAAGDPAVEPVPAPADAPKAPSSAEGRELQKLRAERRDLEAKVAAYEVPEKDGQKSLRGRIKAALQEKLGHLGSLETALEDQTKYRHPDATVIAEERQLTALVRAARAALDQAVKSPDALLPRRYRLSGDAITTKLLDDLKRDLDTAYAERERHLSQAAKFRAESRGGTQAMVQVRDRIAAAKERIAQLSTRRLDRDLIGPGDTGEDTRRLAELRRENLALAIRVSTEQRAAWELEREFIARRGPVSELHAELEERRAGVAYFQAQVLQRQYEALLKARRGHLLARAETKRRQARAASDPLSAYRAGSEAENLRLDAAIEEAEGELAGPIVKLAQDQKNSLHEVEDDFQELMRIVRTSRAQEVVNDRLQRDYRRLESDRSVLASDDLKAISRQLNDYDNRLADVELKLTGFRTAALAEIEAVQARVRPDRAEEARRAAIEQVLRRKDLLRRQAQVLREIDAKLDEARDSMLARLAILDQRATFVRSRIFWIQNEPPLRLTSAPRELRDLAAWAVQLANPRTLWPGRKSASVAFWLALAATLLLPLGLVRLRRGLKTVIRAAAGSGPAEHRSSRPPRARSAGRRRRTGAAARQEDPLDGDAVDALLRLPEALLPPKRTP